VLLNNYYLCKKSRRMRGAGHVACIMEKRNSYRVLVGNHEGIQLLGKPGVFRLLKLKWIIWKQDGRAWDGLIWLKLWIRGELL
jgi:hypothetical protein